MGDFCTYCLKTVDHLFDHQAEHIREVPFSCLLYICKNRFATKGELISHFSSVHLTQENELLENVEVVEDEYELPSQLISSEILKSNQSSSISIEDTNFEIPSLASKDPIKIKNEKNESSNDDTSKYKEKALDLIPADEKISINNKSCISYVTSSTCRPEFEDMSCQKKPLLEKTTSISSSIIKHETKLDETKLVIVKRQYLNPNLKKTNSNFKNFKFPPEESPPKKKQRLQNAELPLAVPLQTFVLKRSDRIKFKKEKTVVNLSVIEKNKNQPSKGLEKNIKKSLTYKSSTISEDYKKRLGNKKMVLCIPKLNT